MGRNKKLTDVQLTEIYNKYYGLHGYAKQSLLSMAPEYGVSQALLSQNLKMFVPPVDRVLPKQEPEPIETLSQERTELLEQYALFLWRFAGQQKPKPVTELRLIDAGRFQQVLNTELGLYLDSVIKRLVDQGKLVKGTRGGYCLL